MSLKSILNLGAFEIADLIRKQEISPYESIQVHIDQAELVNPYINAITEKLYDEALIKAQKQTQQFMQRDQQLPLLFGVPFTIKEMMAHKGSRRTGGSYHQKDSTVDFDGSIVQRIKNAGAIPIATTNVPELGFWFECYNPVYGMTKNPYDYSRTPGGSSGGEAAIIGAGASPFGLGSDIGGSIRMPSSFCGIYGHKPTNKIIPITGHFPFSVEEIRNLKGAQYPYTTHGPMARRAKDLYTLTKLMIGPDGIDSETRSDFVLKEKPRDFSKIKIYYISSPEIFMASQADDEIKNTHQQVINYFKDLGCELYDLKADIFSKAALYWSHALKQTKNKTFEEALSNEQGLSIVKELISLAFGRPKYTLPSLGTSVVDRITRLFKTDSQKILQEVDRKINEINNLLGDNAVLIMPTFPTTAPKHYHAIFKPFDFLYTAIFNALQLPATSAHVRLSQSGMPIGVQIVAAQFNDHLTIAAAEEIEKGFGGWSAPKPFKN